MTTISLAAPLLNRQKSRMEGFKGGSRASSLPMQHSNCASSIGAYSAQVGVLRKNHFDIRKAANGCVQRRSHFVRSEVMRRNCEQCYFRLGDLCSGNAVQCPDLAINIATANFFKAVSENFSINRCIANDRCYAAPSTSKRPDVRVKNKLYGVFVLPAHNVEGNRQRGNRTNRLNPCSPLRLV